MTYTDGRFDADGANLDNDPTWLNMQTQVSGSSFAFGDVTYTAPAAGSYRITVFNERDPRLGGEVGRDVNRDGNPAGSSGLFPVLWNGADTVWVDTDQDASFADVVALLLSGRKPEAAERRLVDQAGQVGTLDGMGKQDRIMTDDAVVADHGERRIEDHAGAVTVLPEFRTEREVNHPHQRHRYRQAARQPSGDGHRCGSDCESAGRPEPGSSC